MMREQRRSLFTTGIGLVVTLALLLLAGCSWNINNTNSESTNAIAITGESTVEVGHDIQLSVKYKYQDGTPSVEWLSSDKTIATVSATGLVTGVATGTTKVAAILADSNDSVYAFWSITVVYTPVTPTSFSATLSEETVYPGDITYVQLAATPSDAATGATYVSSDTSVASVSSNGTITALSVGTATVSITSTLDETVTASVTVTVAARAGAPEELILSEPDHAYVGSSAVLSVTVAPAGALRSVNWSTSDPSVATVSATGVLSFLGSGTVTITAVSTEDATIKALVTLAVAPIEATMLENNVENVIEYASESVLGVSNYIRYQDTESLVKKSIGSCFVYKAWANLKDGTKEEALTSLTNAEDIQSYGYYAITNRHVVLDAAAIRVLIYALNGEVVNEEVDATVVQYDTKVDLAVITFSYGSYIHPLTLADSTTLKAGEFTVALGYPEDFPLTATFGIVSYPSRYINVDTDSDNVTDWTQEYIQTDAALNPGSSGGPLLSLSGEVIGITAMKYVRTNDENLAFAIPSSLIATLLPDLEAGVQPVRVKLGINCVSVKKMLNGYYGTTYPASTVPARIKHGFLIVSTTAGSIAEDAGIKTGDYLMSFNGVDLYENEDLNGELGKLVEGSGVTVTMVVYRDGAFLTLSAVI